MSGETSSLSQTKAKTRELLTITKRLEGIFRELGQDKAAIKLGNDGGTLETLLTKPLLANIAFIGLTGAGKTTLLNALIRMKVGTSGGGQAQSAVPISLKYAENKYLVTVSYLSLDDINDLIFEVKMKIERKDLSKLPNQQGLSTELDSFIEIIEISPTSRAKKHISVNDIAPNIRKLIGKRTSITFNLNEEHLLQDFVREHTNSKGSYWSITNK